MAGPRRIGKTTFIKGDLQPYVIEQGHAAVYVSFWSNSSPTAVLGKSIVDLLEAAENGKRANFQEITQRLQATIDVEGVDVSFDLGTEAEKANEEQLGVLSSLLLELADNEMPAFLFLDEFQEVARTVEGPAFLAMLRTVLDRNKQGLKAVFLGSSMYGMNTIFADKDGPFYRFATPVDLPHLGDEFVEFMLDRVKAVSSHTIDRCVVLNAFETFGKNPLLLRSWLNNLLLNPEMDPKGDASLFIDQTAERFGFDESWRTLTPQNRAMARLVAEAEVSPLSEEGGQRWAELTSDEPMSAQSRQSMLRTLLTRDIIHRRGRGTYEVSDPILRNYILNRPEDDYRRSGR